MKLMNRRAFVGSMGTAGVAAALAAVAPKVALGAEEAPTADDVTAAPAEDGWAPTALNPEVEPVIPEIPVIYSDAEVEEILFDRAEVTTDWVNEDGSTVAPAFQMARNTINRSGNGFGSTVDKDHQLDLMQYLFSEDEALAYSQMPLYHNFTVGEFAKRSGRSEEECLEICNNLADRALLRRTYENGKPVFLALDSEYGYYEAYVQNFNAEYLAAKDLNAGSDMGPSFYAADYTLYRTMPVDLSTVIDGEYTDMDDWHAIFKRHDKFAVSPCMCRVSTLIREGKAATTQEAMELFEDMRDCHHPLETCIVTGKQAEYFIEIGAGREVTAEEAEAILQHSVDEGMIVDTIYTKEVENICSCHADCCLYVGSIRRINGGPAIKNCSNFDLMHNKDACIKCGMCEAQCPMFAITMDEDGYPIVDSACVRCGQCATVCPQQARGLKLKDESERLEIPKDLADLYDKKARARAKRGLLFDITSQEDMQAIVEASQA